MKRSVSGVGPREEVERQLQIVALLVHVPLLFVLPPDPKFPIGFPCTGDELVLGCWTWLIFRLTLNLERSYRCEPVARAGINQGDEILVDVPHNGITEKEDRLLPKNTDRVGPFEEVRHGD